jgi:hypothetical protein
VETVIPNLHVSKPEPLGKSLRDGSRAPKNKFKAFARELGRDARAFFVAGIEAKERKRNA